MTLWIDPPAWPAHGRLWSHLISDTSYAELHEFAAAQGIPRRAHEGDHYDVPQERYAALVAAGATPVGGRELARILRDSGLRVQKRRHERVLLSVWDAPWLPLGGRADVIASRQRQAPAGTVLVRLALRRGADLLVVDRPDSGVDLPGVRVGGDDPAAAVARLHRELVRPGPGLSPPELLGYVRNTVTEPTQDYPWPAPKACFAVYTADLADRHTTVGTWLDAARARRRLHERHWWPLFETDETDAGHTS